MKDNLIRIEDTLKEKLKGEINVSYYNGVLWAQLENNFLNNSISVGVQVPEEHICVEIALENIADSLYIKLKHLIEKNIFTWYDK